MKKLNKSILLSMLSLALYAFPGCKKSDIVSEQLKINKKENTLELEGEWILIKNTRSIFNMTDNSIISSRVELSNQTSAIKFQITKESITIGQDVIKYDITTTDGKRYLNYHIGDDIEKFEITKNGPDNISLESINVSDLIKTSNILNLKKL